MAGSILRGQLMSAAGAVSLISACGVELATTKHSQYVLKPQDTDVTAAEPEIDGPEPSPSKESKEHIDALQLADSSTAWCPEGSKLDTNHWLCVQGIEALGPFPAQMIDSCIKAGGGQSACKGDKWNAAFAKQIRGTTSCPPGTTLDSAIGECRSGEDVFGPFSKQVVERCLSVTGDSPVCKTQRIHRSFVTKSGVSDTYSQLSVPYYYQYNNAYEPSRTCNITSVAMVLSYYGANITPDQIYRRAGGPVFTGPDMIWTASLYGFKGTFSQSASISTIKGHIDAGRPVIVQGWFTKSGHIMVITGYDNKGWIVNDPAGLWSRCYACGYPARTASNGKGARYSYAAMEDAATDPGRPNSYWITVLTR